MNFDPKFLTTEEVIGFHADQLRLYGGIDGIRDRGSLESAVSTPQASFGDTFLHKDIFSMGAAYAFHIAENQPFLDGNKRTALNAALAFLGLNGWDVVDPESTLYDTMLSIAEGRINKTGLAKILQKLSIPTPDSH